MILKKLVLNNFRQYFGNQEIIFASQKDRNVTIIHGENGFGKTCFLNALLWGFYGADGLTEDLPKRMNIIPDHVREVTTNPLAETSLVKISFKHGECEYTLERSITLAAERASKGQDTDLKLSRLEKSGMTSNFKKGDAQKIIDSILPKDLRELVFFNGENIDHLAMEENKEKVRDSVRGLLGLKLIEKAIDDLKSSNVRGKLKEDLKLNTDSKTTELLEQQSLLEEEINKKKNQLNTCRDNKAALNEKMLAINAKLEANRETREFQQRRASLESELKEAQKKIQDSEKNIGDLLATDGYTLFCAELAERGKIITQKLRMEGRIPARVMNEFIHDLLKAEECICGTCLPKGTAIWQKVEEQLTKAGHPEFNRAVGELDKAIGVIEGSINRTRELIVQQISDKTDLGERISTINEDLVEISQAIGRNDNEEIHKLEEQREKEDLRRDELLLQEGGLKSEIEIAENEYKKKNEEIQAMQQKGELGKRAQRRLQRLDEVIDLLEKILCIESEDLCTELGKEVEKTFRKISLHDYRLNLEDNFTLRLSKSVLGSSGPVRVDVATGTGQRQVMSLVFIASLVALAQRRNKIPTILRDLHGGDYPLVMDSPFGQLGDEFRSAIAKHVPNLAPQTIVLVSSSQYKGDVERELGVSNRVGKRYILRYHAPSKREDAKESITLGGKRYTIFKHDSTEHTEIEDCNCDN